MKKETYIEVCKRLQKIIEETRFDEHLYSVGGCVRDYIMGNEIKDIDLVVDLPEGGIEFADWLYRNDFLTHNPVTYPTYGTAMFKLKEFPEIELEIVQTRKEQYKDKNSRNPEVEYGTINDDAFRRDLTINALYYNISTEETIDPTGKGFDDIKNHIIRITNDNPDIVLKDDPLRELRVCRFSSRYQWEIEPNTFEAMKRNVSRLSIISKERIADELNKMLLCDHPVMAMELIKEIGAMKYVIPELEETYEMTQNKYHFGTVWEHTLKTLEYASIFSNLLVVRMAALLHDIGKIKTRTIDENGKVHFYQHELASGDLAVKILRRLKYSNSFINEIVFLVKNHMRTKQWGNDCITMKDKTLRKLQYHCYDSVRFTNLLKLIHADNLSHASEHCLPDQYTRINKRTREMVEDGTAMFDYNLPVDGNDIMECRNILPGKEVKDCQDYLIKLAYNNPIRTREEWLKHIKGYRIN